MIGIGDDAGCEAEPYERRCEMAAGSDVKRILRRLSDSNVMIVDPAQDVRGRQVEDAAGQKIGKIDDLLNLELVKRIGHRV